MTLHSALLRRQPPLTPYRSTGRVLHAPCTLIKTTIAMLQSVGEFEAACLWLGNSNGHQDTVQAVVMPRQHNQKRNYSIDPNAMCDVATYARPNGWTLLANIHSHPGDDVEHSSYDDEMMPSRNALSIVFPMYGQWNSDWPSGVGVHEFIDGYWHLLPSNEAEKRIVWLATTALNCADLR